MKHYRHDYPNELVALIIAHNVGSGTTKMVERVLYQVAGDAALDVMHLERDGAKRARRFALASLLYAEVRP